MRRVNGLIIIVLFITYHVLIYIFYSSKKTAKYTNKAGEPPNGARLTLINKLVSCHETANKLHYAVDE